MFSAPLARTVTLCGLAVSSTALGQVGVTFCSATTNSTGGPARLFGEGQNGVLANDLALRCEGLAHGSAGYFLIGSDAAPVSQPGGSLGNLCLGGTFGRFRDQVLAADGLGRVRLQLDLLRLPGAAQALAPNPGDTLRFQYWYRDRDTSGAAVSNFSEGLEVRFARCLPGFATTSISMPGQATDFALADFDSDGLLDLAATDFSGARVRIQRGLGNGAFSPWLDVGGLFAPLFLGSGDLDSDGRLDLVVRGQGLRVLLQQSPGNFVPQLATPCPPISRLELVDLDGDGLLDVVATTNGTDELLTFHNSGAGALSPGLRLPTAVIAHTLLTADFDGDGAADVFVPTGFHGAALHLHRGDGSGGFAAPILLAGDGEYRTAASVDVDRDGLPELILGKFSAAGAQVVVRQNLGALAFGPEQPIATFNHAQRQSVEAVTSADYDGDGFPDLIVATREDLYLLVSRQSGGFSAPVRFATVPSSRGLRVGDVDRDGIPDVVSNQPQWSTTGVHLARCP